MRFFRLVAVLFAAITALPPARGASGPAQLLIEKARTLEGRGRLDLAAQTWKQVLMAEPNQPEALASLARFTKQTGQLKDSQLYLERLKRINPNDPALGQIQAMRVLSPEQA